MPSGIARSGGSAGRPDWPADTFEAEIGQLATAPPERGIAHQFPACDFTCSRDCFGRNKQGSPDSLGELFEAGRNVHGIPENREFETAFVAYDPDVDFAGMNADSDLHGRRELPFLVPSVDVSQQIARTLNRLPGPIFAFVEHAEQHKSAISDELVDSAAIAVNGVGYMLADAPPDK